MTHPRTPLGAISEAWTGKNAGKGFPMAEVNGDVISSNTPRGVLKRFETWIRRHDIGAEGNEIVVTLTVMGNKCIVLTPTRRRMIAGCGMPVWKWIQNFDVKLWNFDREYDCLTADLMTMTWDYDIKKNVRIRPEHFID